MKKRFNCKDPYELHELRMIHPKLMLVFAALNYWCDNRSLPLVITSIIRTEEENKRVGAKSRTHIEGRAMDISVKDWDEQDIMEAQRFLEGEYYHWGAISKDTQKRRLVVLHKGTAMHLHIQIAKGI